MKSKNKLTFNAYIIQFVSVKSAKVIDENLLLERDSCSSYGWHHMFVKSGDWRLVDNGQLEFNLTGLSQFTTYAFLVQTYQYGANETSNETEQNSTEFDGAISQVKKFRTNLKVPSRVKNLETVNKTTSSVTLRWSVIVSEEPAITAFYLDVVKIPFNVTLIDRRDYCMHPIDKSEEIEVMETIKVEQNDYEDDEEDDERCCSRCCKLQEEQKLSRELEDSNFEADLVKFSDEVPRKDFQLPTQIKKLPTFIDRITIAPGNRSYTIFNLDPFTAYTFYLRACSGELKCSEYELHTELTQMSKDESYDRVELQPTSYVYESANFHVRFQEPAKTNGVIISYVTEVREIVGNDSIYLFTDCITRRQHEINEFKWVSSYVPYIYRPMMLGIHSQIFFESSANRNLRVPSHGCVVGQERPIYWLPRVPRDKAWSLDIEGLDRSGGHDVAFAGLWVACVVLL